MNEFLSELLMTVITAAVPVLLESTSTEATTIAASTAAATAATIAQTAIQQITSEPSVAEKVN